MARVSGADFFALNRGSAVVPVRCLLVGVGHSKQRILGERLARQLKAHRQVFSREAAVYRYGWQIGQVEWRRETAPPGIPFQHFFLAVDARFDRN